MAAGKRQHYCFYAVDDDFGSFFLTFCSFTRSRLFELERVRWAVSQLGGRLFVHVFQPSFKLAAADRRIRGTPDRNRRLGVAAGGRSTYAVPGTARRRDPARDEHR